MVVGVGLVLLGVKPTPTTAADVTWVLLGANANDRHPNRGGPDAQANKLVTGRKRCLQVWVHICLALGASI